MQLDMFSASTASFRDQLLADQPAVGPDGATWELVRWGQKGFQFWGFARTAPGEITLAWINSGIREHQDRIAAVDELELRLRQWGDDWRARDEKKALRSARVGADLFRIRCAVPQGWRWDQWGLGTSSWSIRRPYVRDEPHSPMQTVYLCDLYNDEGLADRIIASMAAWVWPPAPEPASVDVEEQAVVDEDEQLGMAL